MNCWFIVFACERGIERTIQNDAIQLPDYQTPIDWLIETNAKYKPAESYVLLWYSQIGEEEYDRLKATM